MEVNIETAVRVCPLPYNNINNNNNNNICLQPNTINNTIELTNSLINYQFNYVYPLNIKQNQIFQQSIVPLINYIVDGCDVSIITIGQTNTGKTYTLYGSGINILANESEYGIIPRFIRQLFNKIKQYRNRQTTIHITWSQIYGENIQDLFGGLGSIECNCVNDIFQLIEYGMANITVKNAHTLFTLTLEQHWLIDNVVQHRISTASFCDLASTDKLLIYDNCGVLQTIPTDYGMQILQKCIVGLSEQFLNNYNNNNSNHINIPYNQSVLTTLLRDSFGGRAKTLLICCVSPLIQDLTETLYTLQFGIRCQTIKNFVTINSYQTNDSINDNCDLFTLQFTTNQLFKLVLNAEEIFQKLLKNQQLTKFDSEQITKWLLLKQECDDCFHNEDDDDDNQQNRSLERIDEEIEDFTSITDSLIENTDDDDDVDEDEEDSDEIIDDDTDDDDDDIENDQDLSERIDNIYNKFRINTNKLIDTISRKDYPKDSSIKTSHNSVNNSEYHTRGARGRRGSIHCVEELSNFSQNTDDFLTTTTTTDNDEVKKNETKKRQILLNLESYEKQIIELEQTIKIKENLIKQLIKNKDTKCNIKEKFEQKLEKLKNQYKNTEDKFLQTQDEKYRKELKLIEDKLQIIKTITNDNNCKLLELENSLHITRKQLEKMKKHKSKEEKRKTLYEEKPQETNDGKSDSRNDEKSKNLPLVLLESKDTTLSQDEMESLRHEIRNLRKTRDYLLEQRYKIDTKTNKKLLNDLDERKLLKYEEAIEAIDLAIEYKNQFLCGNNDCNIICNNHQENCEEKADKLLMENHLKLNNNEMRLLLQQFFNKIIDIRLNSRKLELQLINSEQENDNLLIRLHNLNQTLQRVRLDNEKRLITLQKQYEDRLQLVLKHFNDDNNTGNADKVLSRVVGTRSKHCAVTLQMPSSSSGNNNNNNNNNSGTKHLDKNSLITRFTRYATRHETSTVPRQLQNVTPAVPQAKVTRQKNKIFIQQTNK